MARGIVTPLFLAAALAAAGAPAALADEADAGRPKSGEVKIGVPLPDFSLADQDGKIWKLSAQKGKKTVIITFGSIMCLCGRNALKDLQMIQDKYAPRGLQVVHVNTEPWQLAVDPQYLSRFAKENKIIFPLLVDKYLAVSSRFPLVGMPFLCLVDREGILRLTLAGRLDDYVKRVTEQVEKYLPPPPKEESKDQKSAPEAEKGKE